MKPVVLVLALLLFFCAACSAAEVELPPPALITRQPSRTPFQPQGTFTPPVVSPVGETPLSPSLTLTPTATTIILQTETPTDTQSPTIQTETPADTQSPTIPTQTPTNAQWPTLTTPLPEATHELTPTPPVVMLGNLHMHTTCSDGLVGYEEMVNTSLGLGFNFISITDHSMSGIYMGCSSPTDCSEACATLVEKCQGETRLLCFPGTEITGRVHLLAIGIGPGVLETLPVAEQAAQIHAQGGLAIAAHPFNSIWRYGDEELFFSGLDAMECIPGVRPRLEEQQQLSADNGLPCVYTSDAHEPYYLRVRYMACSQAFSDVAGLKAVLDAGACWMVTPTPKDKQE